MAEYNILTHLILTMQDGGHGFEFIDPHYEILLFFIFVPQLLFNFEFII